VDILSAAYAGAAVLELSPAGPNILRIENKRADALGFVVTEIW